MPYTNAEQATTFSLDIQVHGCLLENAWAKFPHKDEKIELNSWISADCIDIISSRNKLYFKVSKSIHYLTCTILSRYSVPYPMPRVEGKQRRSYVSCLRPKRLLLLELNRHYFSLLLVVEEISSAIARNNNYVQFPMRPWLRFQTKLSASKGSRDAVNRYELYVHFLSKNKKRFMPDTSGTSGTGWFWINIIRQ